MSARKERLVAGVVLALALWPAVHLFLVARFEIDPWELMGWGMYSVPGPQVHARMEQLVEGRPLLVRPSDASLARLDAFATARSHLGRLVSVDALGRDLLALEPEMEGVVVILRRWSLDRDSAHFDFREERFRFEREPKRDS
jgi:hypothetical protein